VVAVLLLVASRGVVTSFIGLPGRTFTFASPLFFYWSARQNLYFCLPFGVMFVGSPDLVTFPLCLSQTSISHSA
jgi:hypothetical protein